MLASCLRRRIVGRAGKVVGQSLVAIELVRHTPLFQRLRQFDALREGRQLVNIPVEEAERGQPFEMVCNAVLVLWVTIDNRGALWLSACR